MFEVSRPSLGSHRAHQWACRPPSLLPAGRRDGRHHYWAQEGGGAADHRLGSCGGAKESVPPRPPPALQ